MFIVILMVLAAVCVTADVPLSQRSALNDVYSQCNGINWGPTLHNWTTSSEVCGGRWGGVTCDPANETVTALNMLGVNMSCQLPLSLVNLTGLEILKMERSSLIGTIPVTIINLLGLTQLFLSNNNLTGTVPHFLFSEASLFNNSFTGPCPVPKWLKNISNYACPPRKVSSTGLIFITIAYAVPIVLAVIVAAVFAVLKSRGSLDTPQAYVHVGQPEPIWVSDSTQQEMNEIKTDGGFGTF